ncbi:hypothetical protein STXM2123_914 [Streptomyces sp. F-3]|nr:hypothetical protein STXM2123_914 [Streptomyces sp. F-3]
MAQPQAFGRFTEQLLNPIPVGLRTGERYLRQKLPDMEELQRYPVRLGLACAHPAAARLLALGRAVEAYR